MEQVTADEFCAAFGIERAFLPPAFSLAAFGATDIEPRVLVHADGAAPWASVTKLVTTLAALIAVEDGSTSLDDAAGPPGSTLRHLLAHASGLPLEGAAPIAPPARRRIYSNRGFDTIAAHLALATDYPWRDFVTAAVIGPLGMSPTVASQQGGTGAVGSIADLAALITELRHPRLIAPETLAEATTPQWPELDGVVPGFGAQRPNPWGLGFEIRGQKHPHWTGANNSPRTFGHFGRAGSFVWHDPDALVSVGFLSHSANTDDAWQFGPWAAASWPAIADRLLAALA